MANSEGANDTAGGCRVLASSGNPRASQPHAGSCAPKRISLVLTAALLAVCGCRSDASRAASGLIVLLPRDVQEIDPRFVSDPYGHKLSRLLFASLVTIDPQTLEVIPDLAERVDVTAPNEYRATLRPGLSFSDGSALDADDVVATFHSIVDPRLATRYAATYRRIAKVFAADARTVVFQLDGPHATFLTDLELPILRAEDAGHRIGMLGGPEPIGAGPYRLLRRETGRVVLEKNPRWYAGVPIFPEVTMLVVRDDNIRTLRLLAGAGDLALSAVPTQLLPLFAPAGLDVTSARGISTTYIGINTKAGPLADARVRQAIAYAIDRPALIRAKLGGRAQLARTPIPPGHWAFDPNTPLYAFDPEKASALLEAAGLHADAAGVRLHVSLRCGSERFRLSVARAIAAMLHDVGIEAELRPSETATLIAQLDRGQFELTMLQLPELIEPHVLTWFFGTDHIPAPGREGANRWRFSDAALDAALERGRQTVVRSERIAAYRDAQLILAQQLPIIPLWHEDVIAVRSARAKAFVVPRDGRFSTLAR